MDTVEQWYREATAYVHRAIDAVERAPSLLNVIDRQAATLKTRPVRDELARIEARWLRATSDAERTRIQRDADLLADRTKENLPGAPQDWKRTNLYAGERETSTPATSYSGELEHQASSEWSWLKRSVADATHVGGDVGKWLLAGGALLLGIKTVNYLGQRERRRNRSGANVRRQLDHALVVAADHSSRNASGWIETMCPVCHRYKPVDKRGRLVAHEYPSGGMCPGGGERPLPPRDASAAPDGALEGLRGWLATATPPADDDARRQREWVRGYERMSQAAMNALSNRGLVASPADVRAWREMELRRLRWDNSMEGQGAVAFLDALGKFNKQKHVAPATKDKRRALAKKPATAKTRKAATRAR